VNISIHILISTLLLVVFAACSNDSAEPASEVVLSVYPTPTGVWANPDATAQQPPVNQFASGLPQTRVVAICNFGLSPQAGEEPKPTLTECSESFEKAEQTLYPGRKIYIFDEDGLLDYYVDTQVVFLNQHVRPLFETRQLLENWARENSYQELRVRRDLYSWSDPIGFMFSLPPKTQVYAVCNLHRPIFTLKECQDSYAQAGETLNIGEKFFLYGEDGVLYNDVLVKFWNYSEELTMPEAVARTSHMSADTVQYLQVKAEGRSWSDPIALNMDILLPSRPMILQVCTTAMSSCTPGALKRSDSPFLSDSIGLAAYEQEHIWLETRIDGDDDFIACYPLKLALKNGAEHCKSELHVPSDYLGGEYTFRNRLVNQLGPGEWSEGFSVELEDELVQGATIIAGSGSKPNADIQAFSSFYLCDETVADTEGNFTLTIDTSCAPAGTTLKILSIPQSDGQYAPARKALTLDASGLNRVEMPMYDEGNSQESIIWALALFEPWSFTRLIFYDLVVSFRADEAEEFLEENLNRFADYMEGGSRSESGELSELAFEYNRLTYEFWFADKDDPDEIQKEIDETGSVSSERLERWVEQIESYQILSDEVLAEISMVVEDLQTKCVRYDGEAPQICTEDFAVRSRRLRALYEAIGHPATHVW
jgi:hypothetical protein